MQQKNITLKQFAYARIEWAKAWHFCAVLIGVVSYLIPGSGFATDPPPATYSFDSLTQLDFDQLFNIIPRPSGAVSRDYVMTALYDRRILFQRKDGSPYLSPITEHDFWDCSTLGCDPIEPSVVFDPSTNRWFFVARDNGPGHLGKILIGVSKGGDPRNPANWYRWSVDTYPYFLITYPKIGFSDKWVGVVFEGNPASEFSFSLISVFDKASLIAGDEPVGSGTGQNYKIIAGSHEFGSLMCPARTYDPNVSDLFLLQSTKYYNVGGTNDRLTYYKIYGNTAGDVQLSAGTEVIAHAPWGVVAWDAPQLHDPDGLPYSIAVDDDDRIQSCIFRNGSLWTVHTVALPADTQGLTAYSAVQWWQIKPGTGTSQPTVVQVGVIGGPPPPLGNGDGNFRAFPSIAVNANENVLIGYGLFGSTFYPSGAYSFRNGTDPLSSMRTELPCGTGLGPWEDGVHPHFWGDISASIVDPADDRTMWTIQQYTKDAVPTSSPTPCAPTCEDDPDAPSPRFWATHWVGISTNFGRFVGGAAYSLGVDLVASTAVAASGRNNTGQLGNNSTTNVNHPIATGASLSSFGLFNIIDVAAGPSTSFGVDTFGSVYVWGWNTVGQRGTGSTDFSAHSTPAPVPCASPNPCWNGNFTIFKQDNGGKPYYVPVSTGFGISPTLVSHKLSATAAVDYLGQVWMWGQNTYGQLGDGSTTDHYTPKLVTISGLDVPSLKSAVSIETADYTTIALMADRTVWAWGSGNAGVLGDGDTSGSSSHYVTHPQQVLTGVAQPLTGVVQLACGRLSDFCLALTQDGTVYGWGANGSNQLGLGDTTDRGYATPIQVIPIPSGATVRRIAVGAYHSLALASDGRVYAWGQGGYGQTGFGSTGGRSQATPRLMEGTNSGYTDIAAGNNFSLMIRGNASPPEVWGTGDNTYGQLATGSSTSLYSLPTQTLY